MTRTDTPTPTTSAAGGEDDAALIKAWEAFGPATREGVGDMRAACEAYALARRGAQSSQPAPAPSAAPGGVSEAEVDEPIFWLLKLLSAAGGSAAANDGVGEWINGFCEDRGRETDTFNLAIDRGLTKSWHNSLLDTSTVEITEKGRASLEAAAKVRPQTARGDGADVLVEREFSQAASDIIAERRRQVEVEGWTPEHDDAHQNGEMARAAGVYALNAGRVTDNPSSHLERWPWSIDWWKPTDRRRDLVKAGALILAEIDRLDRASDRARSAPQPSRGEGR